MDITSLKKGVSNLEDRNNELIKENGSLRKDIANLNVKISDLEKDNKSLHSNVSKLLRQQSIDRAKLLVGAVAYCFLRRMIETLFGQHQQLSKELTSLEKIYEKARTEKKEAQYQGILTKYNIDVKQFDKALNEMRGIRLKLGHPTRITQEEEDDDENSDPPTPIQLKEQADLVFNNKKSKQTKEKAHEIIDVLFELSSKQGKEILERD